MHRGCAKVPIVSKRIPNLAVAYEIGKIELNLRNHINVPLQIVHLPHIDILNENFDLLLILRGEILDLLKRKIVDSGQETPSKSVSCLWDTLRQK